MRRERAEGPVAPTAGSLGSRCRQGARWIPTAEDLLALPIDGLPDEIVAIAERLAEAPVGLYVVDLEGVSLRRLAGASSFPEEVPIPQMAGPEIPTGHLAALEREFAARGLGTIVPLWLRHRAIAVFLVDGAPAAALEEFAARAAGVLELSLRYTDRLAGARHRQRATAGAELQQLLLPPRIAGHPRERRSPARCSRPTTSAATGSSTSPTRRCVAGGRRRLGQGPARIRPLRADPGRAARDARGGRLARRGGGEMDRAILGFGDPSMFVTALLARWNYADSTLEWLTFGHPQPCRITAGGQIDDLGGTGAPPLGLLAGQPFALARISLRPGDRVVVLLRRRDRAQGRSGNGSASTGLHDHMTDRREPSAASLLTHILSHVTGLHETPLEDDATVVVLGVLDDQTHEPPASPPVSGTTAS